MAQSSTETSGQLAGLNDRFQTGLAQVQQYLVFHQLQQFQPAGGQAVATRPPRPRPSRFSDFTYATKQLVTNANLDNPLPGLSASDSFTIAVKKGGTTTNVAIDLSARCRAR